MIEMTPGPHSGHCRLPELPGWRDRRPRAQHRRRALVSELPRSLCNFSAADTELTPGRRGNDGKRRRRGTAPPKNNRKVWCRRGVLSQSWHVYLTGSLRLSHESELCDGLVESRRRKLSTE